ncbi:sulfurtransferase TusA family protein [Johnsonella ignava]|jgi:Predicted redox protein, regulator of disulfide bond formation|uniref:sulfurtransferase TusA family protein n=1 Tax=Johnsonella ignava TaxID=43995 RepID=UPI0023F36F97|nr:sulfurtransferase TusA family protein [Johnsonella ignava]
MVDARGFSCPMPVVMTKKEIEKTKAAQLEVMVDNKVSVENVTRFAQNIGYSVEVVKEGEDFKLKLKK